MTLPSDELTPIWRLRHFGEKTAWKLARCTYSKAALFQLPFGLLFGRVSYDIEDSATRAPDQGRGICNVNPGSA